MKKILIVLLICISQYVNAQNLVDTALSAITRTSTTIGEVKVTFNNDGILVTNFTYSKGIVGTNKYGYSYGFSFDKLDEFVYKMVTRKAKGQYVTIRIQMKGFDKYGNRTDYDPVTIGKINVAESKKYTDFTHWRQLYEHQTEQMFKTYF